MRQQKPRRSLIDRFKLKDCVSQIQQAEMNIQINFWTIGKKLLELKEIVPHGEWEKTVEENFTFSLMTAKRLMMIARTFKSTKVVDLGLKKCLELIESVPDSELEEDGTIQVHKYVDDDDEYEEKFPKYEEKSECIFVSSDAEARKKEERMQEVLEEAKTQKGYFIYMEDALNLALRRIETLKLLVDGLHHEVRKEHWDKYENRDWIISQVNEVKEVAKKIKKLE